MTRAWVSTNVTSFSFSGSALFDHFHLRRAWLFNLIQEDVDRLSALAVAILREERLDVTIASASPFTAPDAAQCGARTAAAITVSS